jgi:hypothetical protein
VFLILIKSVIKNKTTGELIHERLWLRIFQRSLTAYLDTVGTLENAQAMAAHESPRTTKLYERTGDEIALDEVERIAI